MSGQETMQRWGTHYDSLPHGNCIDPKHCDCNCKGCVKDRGFEVTICGNLCTCDNVACEHCASPKASEPSAEKCKHSPSGKHECGHGAPAMNWICRWCEEEVRQEAKAGEGERETREDEGPKCFMCGYPEHDGGCAQAARKRPHEFIWRADSLQCSLCGEEHSGCVIVKQPTAQPDAERISDERLRFYAEWPEGDSVDECDASLMARELLQLRPHSTTVELELRRMMWLGHGHSGIYGDDGEMQCIECAKFGVTDYKREPLDKVRETFRAVQMSRVAEPAKSPSGAEGQLSLLAEALGKILLKLGVINDQSLTGPELLMATETFLNVPVTSLLSAKATGLSWHCTNGFCDSCGHGRDTCACVHHLPNPQVRIQPGQTVLSAEDAKEIGYIVFHLESALMFNDADMLKSIVEKADRKAGPR